MNKLDVILILTNQCNLNCAYCIYACDIKSQAYYITIEEIKNTLILMKQKIPSLNKLILSGGDPFMHPKFIEICEEIRKIFPQIELCAYTNGLILQKFSDNDIINLTKNLKLNIISSLYPSIKNLQEYKKQDERFKKLNSSLYYQSSHIYFNKQNYKNNNINLPNYLINNQYKKCKTITKYNNIITIYKNKILTCCGEVGFLNNNKNTDISDLLDLTTLNNEQEIYNFCEKPHNICKNCIANSKSSNNFILWQKKSILTERYQENTLETIFVRNYQDYKKLFLENKEHIQCFNDNFFYSKFLPNINPGELEYLNIKYKNGLGDIFIPYDNSFNKIKRLKLLQKLNEIPNIKQYNLYFVGIKTSIKYNQLMFKQFYSGDFTSKIKATFLQSSTLLKGYEEFLAYSYLNKKILLDPENFTIL